MPEVAGFRSRRAVELSGGQQKMVALARALMAGRRMLLPDEPFEALAPALALRLGKVMSSLTSTRAVKSFGPSATSNMSGLTASLGRKADVKAVIQP
jgi:branched-chain amino acid transport system ATP-binding protein